MEGELSWNILRDVIVSVSASLTQSAPRRGHPDVWPVSTVALVMCYSAFFDIPLVHAVVHLKDPLRRKALRIQGLFVPSDVPHATTVARRSRRADYLEFAAKVQEKLARRLPDDGRVAVVDSTPLRVPHTSRDADATHGHHHTRGYRLHMVCAGTGTILGASVRGANVHDLRAATELVAELAARGVRSRWLLADKAYDSERFHEHVATCMGATLIAPLNSRGGSHTMRRTPRRRRLKERRESPLYKGLFRRRAVIERRFSVLKSSRIGLDRLPPWVRGLANVQRWVAHKLLVAQVHEIYRRKHPR